jgi:hypothetical protein
MNINDPETRRWSGSTAMSNDVGANGEDGSHAHVPHPIYQSVSSQISNGNMHHRRQSLVPQQQQPPFEVDPAFQLLASASLYGDRTRTAVAVTPPLVEEPRPILKHKLPDYLKPLPARMTSLDIDFLYAKGALTLPGPVVRNALLQAFLEYVHPYMPLVELQDLLRIIHEGNGESGQISLLLFQAIMFAGTAFVDMEFLRLAGYAHRKAARKAFFQRARVLYDFDYEIDRVSLVQSLLLMTYWYETPDDQKDTWHWMGVAISLAHTIGLHRNPSNSKMEPSRKKLWKRIWWSCFMRDRLVALGMRRPTRVKDEDYDVPMLEEDDFEIFSLPESNTVISKNCRLARDMDAQKELAQMCIAKAKLCLCVSHVLSAQYSVLVKHQGMQTREGSTTSSVMLFPKKLDQTDEVQSCDVELSEWLAELPPSCHYTSEMPASGSAAPIFVHRALLRLVYYTTLSALHRPQVLPTATSVDSSRSLQDLSRKAVRDASREITKVSADLHTLGLERYLPTTGVTVLLPAIIIHLLDIKSANEKARMEAIDGFRQCMQVLQKLRDNYASADFATQFLEAAIRKADIDVLMGADGLNPYTQEVVSDERWEVPNSEDQRIAVSNKAVSVRDETSQPDPMGRRTPPPGIGEGFGLPDSMMLDNDTPQQPSQPDFDAISNERARAQALMNSLGPVNAPTPPDSENNSTASNAINSAYQTQSQDLQQELFHPQPHTQQQQQQNHNTMSWMNSPPATLTHQNQNNPFDIHIPQQTTSNSGYELNIADYLNIEHMSANDPWCNYPMDEGAHGESGGFMGDMGLISEPDWGSRLGTPGLVLDGNVGNATNIFQRRGVDGLILDGVKN